DGTRRQGRLPESRHARLLQSADAQLLLERAALADVAHDHGVAAGVAADDDRGEVARAVLAHQPAVLARLTVPARAIEDVRLVRIEDRDVAADDLVGVVAGHALRAEVPAHYDAVDIEQEDGKVPDRVDHDAERLFAGAQRTVLVQRDFDGAMEVVLVER